MPPTMPIQQQWPRGPVNDLHKAAHRGSTERTIALLSRGSINIDQGGPGGWTPLMVAAGQGHSRVVRILLVRKANVSIAGEHGFSALHLSAQYGHLAVIIDLLKAGPDLGAKTSEGFTPLDLAARNGHSEVMATLIEAGANVDSRARDGGTPLYAAAGGGHLNAVRKLLRAKADPLLIRTMKSGEALVPLDVAAAYGCSKVVGELIQQFGIEGCAGASGGAMALGAAAQTSHVHIMIMLTNAGVVDTGIGLFSAAQWRSEAAVKFLLQQRQREASTTGLVGYVNSRDQKGCTALILSMDFSVKVGGVPLLPSPRVVRLLVDAGADTTSDVRVTGESGVIRNLGTPLAHTNALLGHKKIGGLDATEEYLRRLEAIRRLLVRVEAAHAVSWLWPRDIPSVAKTAGDTTKIATTTPPTGTQLTSMLPVLRRRRRGALLAPLLRYSSYP